MVILKEKPPLPSRVQHLDSNVDWAGKEDQEVDQDKGE